MKKLLLTTLLLFSLAYAFRHFAIQNDYSSPTR